MLIDHNVNFEPGLCSAINKGVFVHADDTSLPKHFSCFFTPPMKRDESVAKNSAILRLAIQAKYSEDDITLLTKVQITIPMDVRDLLHHIKNATGLASKCFGPETMLMNSLRELQDHVQRDEI